MFGLEEQKKKKIEMPVYELEKTLKDPKKYREMKQKIEDRVQKIKTALTTGESKEDFDRFGMLLHGYISLQKVIARSLTNK